MSNERSDNTAASIRQRLLNLSRERGEDYHLVLTWYAVERLLYRLACSEHAKQFILKGAMLFPVWTGRSYRPTRDLDLMGYGDASAQRLSTSFQQICRAQVEPDGLEFDAGSIQVTEIREEQEYQGQRVRLTANLGKARINVQIDIGFGDVVTPEAEEISYPTLLDLPAPRILAYPRESVIAEKLQAMVALGMVNSRMKDFYDLRWMAKQFTFDGSTLVDAIRATFDRRNTEIPDTTPTGLSDEFTTNPDKVTQWRAFLKRIGLEDIAVDLALVVEELRVFIIPPLFAAAGGVAFRSVWTDGGPWSRKER